MKIEEFVNFKVAKINFSFFCNIRFKYLTMASIKTCAVIPRFGAAILKPVTFGMVLTMED